MTDAVIQCEECEALLIDLIEGRLTKEQQEVVSDHLGGCPRCREKREEFELTLLAYHGGESPSPAVRMNVYEMAQKSVKRRVIPLFFNRPLSYAVAALLLVGITLLLRPLWQTKGTTPEPAEITSSLSLPPPPVPDIKVEYGRHVGLPTTWTLTGTRLQRGDGEEASSYEVGSSDVDELIREARRLNIIPIPMLTFEPQECPETVETITLEFEGRRVKGRFCQGGEGDKAMREFVKFFKDWSASFSR